MEVCLLSHEVMLQPLSVPITVSAFAFSMYLLPAFHKVPLRFPSDCSEKYGLTTFHLIDTDNVDSAFSPEAIRPCVPMHSEEHPTSAPFWVRPDSNFGLFCNNDVYQQFRFLSHIIFACSLTVSLLTVLRLPRGCRSFSFRERATVSRSVSSWALLTTL